MTSSFQLKNGTQVGAKFFLGFSFILTGIALIYTMWFSECPKPFSGDGFMNAMYLKSAMWVVTGIITPLIFKPSIRQSMVGGLILIVLTSLLFYAHSLL